MTKSDQIEKLINRYTNDLGPHKRASTNTANHWRGVINHLKTQIVKIVEQKDI